MRAHMPRSLGERRAKWDSRKLCLFKLDLSGAFCLWCLLLAGCSRDGSVQPSAVSEQARDLLKAGQWQQAYETVQAGLQHHPDDSGLLLVAAEAASRLERLDEALELYARIPEAAGHDAALARWASGEVYFQKGHVTSAIEALQASLELEPELEFAHDRLIELYNAVGRRRETQPHIMALLRLNRVTTELLLSIGNLAKEYEAPEELQRFLAADPDDKLPYLGLARMAITAGQLDDARLMLQELLEQQPDLLEAHAQLGTVLLKQDVAQLQQWNARLPSTAPQHPDIWYIRGEGRAENDDFSGAVRCFAEAIRLDPNHLPAHMALAKHLHIEGRQGLSETFAQRAKRLQELNIALEQVYAQQAYTEAMEAAARSCLHLGRLWEAIGWSAAAQPLIPQASWPREVLEAAQAIRPFDPALPQTLPEYSPVANASWLADYPQPDLAASLPARRTPDAPPTTTDAADAIQLANVAQDVGLAFQFFNSAEPGVEGRRMFEITGGGIGVLDFDRDGWYDVFLAQGVAWPPEEQEDRGDVLMRNLESGPKGVRRFAETTDMARIQEAAFGQGVAVGDVNADGFEDLYVCNLGMNQLWLNQGDGTFLDGNFLIESTDDSWTVSAAIADLNADGISEIYDVNYVQGEELFTRRCPIAGKPRACSPLVFSPARHRVLVPTEQGRFVEGGQDVETPLQAYGLGISVFRVNGERPPRVFVAVDQASNLLLRSHAAATAPGGFVLRDEALAMGLAYDQSGRAQACMGIATGDIDLDGAVDLMVTNFYDEYNTLYLQQDGLFEDRSYESGLVAPSVKMLGFGAQAVDLQMDGHLDYVVLNGHIDDQTHIGVPELMRPQVFSNLGSGQFAEGSADSLGDFFQRPGLGRALALIDYNRDGLNDLLCGDLEAPLALLENRSQSLSDVLTLYLVGVQSERSGACSICRLRGNDYDRVQQLVTGGGYMVSNEPCLRFAIPRGTGALSLEIDWISGDTDRWSGLMPGTFIAVEGQGIHRVADDPR